MKLAHPFSNETRNLYLYTHACLLCGGNGMGRGGLELNHIFGRVSASPFNASLLCHECHSHVGHTNEEHAKLFFLNAKYLQEIGYNRHLVTEDDLMFIDRYVTPLYPQISEMLSTYV